MFDDNDEFGGAVLWSSDGGAKVVVPEVDLPHPMAVDRSNVTGWPDVEQEGEQPVMIALRVPPKVGGRYGRDAEDLVDLEPLQDRHITVVTLGKLEPQERDRVHDCVRQWMASTEWPPMSGKAQGWGTFTPSTKNKRNVLWMSWDIPGLGEMRQDLSDALAADGFETQHEHDFTPHETVGYTNDPLSSLPSYPEPDVEHTFDGLVVADGDEWTEYPFQSGLVLASGRPAVVAALEAAVDDELAAMSDADLDALIAAGGADRNRGNAEKLRRYWTVGKGGAKIRWGTPGDWKRCRRLLSKHLGPRAAGYCTLRHKEMTGMYTGDMKHRILYGWGGKPGSYWARVAAKKGIKASGEESPKIVGPDGDPLTLLMNAPPKKHRRFKIPMLLPEGVESGDGRTFEPGVVEFRDMPIPLLWQPNSMQGHDGAMIVGRVDHLERIEGGIGNGYGVFDISPLALEAVRMIEDGFLRGVSADLDKFEAKIIGKGAGTATAGDDADEKDGDKKKDDDVVAPDKMSINQGRIMAATLVAKPAFDIAKIELDDDESEDAVEDVLVPSEGVTAASAALPDGVYRGRIEGALRADAARFAQREVRRIKFSEEMAQFSKRSGLTAAATPVAPVAPPLEWFDNPRMGKPTHLTITDEGRVFGHIAAWNVDHIGMGFGTKPPKSKSNYAYFRTGLLRTSEGVDVRVGQITLSGGHAGLNADAREAVKHYDDTNSAFADVVAGEDRHGIWVAGALRPEVTEGQLRAARASSPSGDWRPIGGKLELVAVCQVNVPGFPVVEARVASGQVLALVAAGTAPLIADLVSAPEAAVEMIGDDELAAAPVDEEDAVEQAPAEGLTDEEQQAVDDAVDIVVAEAEEGGEESAPEDEDEAALRRPTIREMAAMLAAERLEVAALSVRERMAGLVADSIVAAAPEPFTPPQGMTIREAAALLFAVRDAESEEAVTAAARHSLPDGTWRIADPDSLKEAVENFGSCSPEDRSRVKRHIVRRAMSLGADELLPSWWRDDVASLADAGAADPKAQAPRRGDSVLSTDSPAEAEFSKQPVSTERRKEMAKAGEALPDGAYPIKDVADLKRAIQSYGRAKESERKKVRDHIKKRARSLGHPELIPDDWKDK